jgi:hypothetical protein
MVSPSRDFAKEAEQDDMLSLAAIIEQAVAIEIVLNDKNLRIKMAANPRKWIADGLRLLARED